MGKTIGSYTNSCRIQILILSFILLSSGEYALSQNTVALPDSPRIPEVDFAYPDEVNDISALKIKMRFYIYGKGDESHTVVIPASLSEFETGHGNKGSSRKISFKDLADIEITEWAGSPDKSGAFIFYPVKYVLTLKSGEKLNASVNIPFFNAVKAGTGENVRFLYSFFYDYYIDGKWVNRGEVSPDPVSTVPLKGCVTRITAD